MKQITCQHLWKIFGPQASKLYSALNEGQELQSLPEKLRQGHVVAVADISFEVARGETFVIMGLSGSGKSTLIRCIARLIEPTAGSLLLDGEDIFRFDAKELLKLRRKRLSMVFQHFGLFAHRRVLDNVAYGLEVQGIKAALRHERAREVLKLVGLEAWENHYPHQLSGGMQQRVGIARALAVNPEILMFDEPFSALDPLIRRDMQDELIRLQRDLQKTILFITHDFLEAVKLGDRIAIMKDGRLVQVGTPAEIVLHPINDYVRDFAKDVPRAHVLHASDILSQGHIISEAELPHAAQVLGAQDKALAFVRSYQGRCLGLVRQGNPKKLEDVTFIAPDLSLSSLLPRLTRTADPLAVISAEGQFLGTVDRLGALKALAE